MQGKEAFTNILLFISETVIGLLLFVWGFPGAQTVGKVSAYNGDLGLIPGLGRWLEEGNGCLLQYSCLGNPMDREARWATVHGVSRSPRHKTGQSE